LGCNSLSGKGDKRIPSQIPEKQMKDNWDRIFKKSKEIYGDMDKKK